MIISFLYRFLAAALLMLVQCLILNHISILGYATPMPYILFLLAFPKGSGRKSILLCGFLLGLVADMFTNTPGVSAASCTLIAMIQPFFLQVMSPRDSAEDMQPTYHTMGFFGFLRYATVLTFIFQLTYYSLLAFSLAHLQDMLINIAGGTLFTLILLLAMATALHNGLKN